MLKNLVNSLPELQREKQQDYRNVVITQVIIVTFGLTLSGPVLENSTSAVSKLIITIFFGFGTMYNFLLWDLLRNFTKNRILIMIIFVILIGMIIFGFLTEFPYYRVLDIDRRATLLIIHGLLFPVEITIIGFAIRDIFMSQYFTPDKLWGSAAVFLMIGISFGSLYDLLCTIKPGSLGAAIELGFPTYSECVNYSFCILGGLDTGYPNPSRLIKNISVFEAVWGTLFSVLIIGKLLGLPKPGENK
ncbi:MAG: hypothetical protein WAZ98_00905 [Cyclobacteriaceae bacterium]